jgi:competence protein ComGC
MNRILTQKGFLMVEVLIVVLILAVAFTAFMGAMAQSLRVSSKSSQTTDAISRFGAILFEMESGLRPDLAGYGGQGDLEGGYHYRIDAERDEELSSLLKSRLSWKEGKESLQLEVFVLQASAQ